MYDVTLAQNMLFDGGKIENHFRFVKTRFNSYNSSMSFWNTGICIWSKAIGKYPEKGLNKHELKRFVYKNYCEEICGIWVRSKLWVNSKNERHLVWN